MPLIGTSNAHIMRCGSLSLKPALRMDQQVSNPHPSEPQVGGPGSRGDQSEALVRTRMLWRGRIAVRMQYSLQGFTERPRRGEIATAFRWAHASKDNAEGVVPCGDRTKQRG